MDEIWKPVPNYEGFYEASNLGRIRSITRVKPFKCRYGKIVPREYKGKILKPTFDGRHMYLQVTLSKDGIQKRELIHRIIAKTFINNPYNLPEVNHKDEDKMNNSVSNLEWCDHKYNNNYGTKLNRTRGINNPGHKITPEIVNSIRKEYVPLSHEYGLAGLGKKYGISETHVCAILKGRRWGWLDASVRDS